MQRDERKKKRKEERRSIVRREPSLASSVRRPRTDSRCTSSFMQRDVDGIIRLTEMKSGPERVPRLTCGTRIRVQAVLCAQPAHTPSSRMFTDDDLAFFEDRAAESRHGRGRWDSTEPRTDGQQAPRGDGRMNEQRRRRMEEGDRGRQDEKMPELYSIHHGKVRRIETYGAFLELEGFRKHGLIHISQ